MEVIWMMFGDGVVDYVFEDGIVMIMMNCFDYYNV